MGSSVGSLATSHLFVEQFPEPVTGWAMLGVGVDVETPDRAGLSLEVAYDGVPRLRESFAWAEAGYRRGVQIPLEPSVETVRVTVRIGGDTATTEYAVAALPTRGAAGPAAPGRPLPRWLSPARTLAQAVASGDCLERDWWQARVERYRQLAARARQKFTDKYALRVHERSRSVHDAFRAATTPTAADLAAMTVAAAKFRHQPTFSVLCPVYNVDPRWLNAAVESVRRQAYPKWELCLADDASTDPATLTALNNLPRDDRIKLGRRAENGHICAATNSAADLATGDFVLLLDNDDELAPQALFRFAELLQARPDADLIYSDEDKLTPEGRHYDPQFKPDWSPDLFTSYNYVNHLACLRRTLFEKVGRFRVGYHGAQDWDLLLRATELTDRVHHVPEILYHWRAVPSSSADDAGAKPFIHDAARRALRDAVARRRLPVTVGVPEFAAKLKLPAYEFDAEFPVGVSVAVVVRGPADAAARTLRAVRATTTPAHVTTYLVLDAANHADGLNRLAAGRGEDFLLFLEAGVEPADPRWLARLLAYARLPGVGAAGGLILDGRGAIVSAGTVVTGYPRDAFGSVTPTPVSYYFQAECARTVTAPGRGCLLVSRAHFERVGGFDADRFPASLYDVDLALRLAGQGLRSAHVGGAVLTWDEATAGRHDAPTERQRLRAAHGSTADPFHNPNLDPDRPFATRPDGPARRGPSRAVKPTVLFATHNLSGYEGAPKILADLALGLHRRGDIVAGVFAPAPGPASARFEAAGVACVAEPRPFNLRYADGRWTPTEYAAAQRHLRGVLKRLKPNVVVANTIGLFPLVEAAARLGIPAVLMVHESYTEAMFQSAFSPYAQARCQRALLLAERVVFGSMACADRYARLDGRKNFTHLHYGLDRETMLASVAGVSRDEAVRRLGGDSGAVRILSVGTVCERKAQHHLVEAAALVARHTRDFRCLLVGAREGLPYLHYVRELIEARGLGDIVEVVAETDRVPLYFRSADVYACTSYVEAFSLSVLEAEAFGLPVVSTPCGGLDEQVVWGQNALKFGFGDVPALAAHLQRLVGDAALRQRLGRESLAMSDAHPTPGQMLDRFAALLESCQPR